MRARVTASHHKLSPPGPARTSALPVMSALACPGAAATAATPLKTQPLESHALQARLQRLKAGRRRAGEASFFWYDVHFQQIAVKVLPGEYAAYDEDLLVATVLGSCIACCLWDPGARVGGMNHFMLPDGDGDAGGRYGAFAMELLINALIKLGASRGTLQAKIFGGGRVMANMNAFDIGERNTRFARDYLQAEGIPITGQDVLGMHPRKLVFSPRSGQARVKKLAAGQLARVTAQERIENARRVAAAQGTVELFRE